MPHSATSHTKHAALARPMQGFWHRHELAVLGTPCSIIGDLVQRLLPRLTSALRVTYADADHKTTDAPDEWLQAGAAASLTNKGSFWRLDRQSASSSFPRQQLLSDQDLLLLNGNHHRARQQLVIIDPRKPLDQKLDQLTDVQLILLSEGQAELPTVLHRHLPNAVQVPVLPLADTEAIAHWLLSWWQQRQAPLYGLVLAGGQSQRMHTDKSRLRYHAQEQRQHAAALLAPYCEEVFVSCRTEQAADLPAGLQPLPDQFLNLGPMSGLLTAFRHNPNAAWLVVACDLPFLTEHTLRYLVALRQAGRLATALRSTESEFPEPLIAIWEPRSYPVLLQWLAQGYSCPRKVLINSDTYVLPAPDTAELRNVNTPEERAAAERELGLLS